MDKQAARERVWQRLQDEGAARFPFPPQGRIPNFAGASAAAERLAGTQAWQRAERLKCNPDAPQLPVRLRALQEGKTVLMAVPRLRETKGFFLLDPGRLRKNQLRQASSIKGAARLGKRVAPEDLGTIDLVVAGSVAVNPQGARVGKGGGYSDLEFGLARQVGAVDAGTPVATTVHELQVLPRAELPMTAHDVPLDLVATPERVIEAPLPRVFRKPGGILWEALSEEQVAAMPPLQALRGTAKP